MSAVEISAQRRGAIAIMTWYLGGWLLLTILLLLDVGPTTWVSGWFDGRLGYDSPVLSFIIVFSVVALPVIVLQIMPWQTGSAFLRGAQHALNPARDPNFAFHPPNDRQMTIALGRLIKITACAALVCLMSGVVGYQLMTRKPPNAGKPLPVLSASQIVARANHLPAYARLIGFAPGLKRTWIHFWTIRQSSYADLYFPITSAAGPIRSPTRMIGKIHYDVGRGEGPGSRPSLTAPIDGKLETVSLPAWMRQEMTAHGFAVSNPIILFTPDASLNSLFPGPDRVFAGFLLFLAIAFALMFAIIAAIYAFRRHRLLRVRP